LLVIVTIMVLQRFGTLTMRDTDFKIFPEECSLWAVNGCTRVVLGKDECLRPKDIPTKFKIVYEKKQRSGWTFMTSQIHTCIDEVKGASLKEEYG